MQSRRRQDHITVSPTSRAHHQLELGSHSDRRTRQDGLDRHERNLNPHKIDGLRRVAGLNKGGDDFQRRDHDWQLGDRRSSQVNSRSPPIEQARKRPFFNEGVRRGSCSPPLGMRPRYEMAKTTKYYVDGENLDTKHAYGYDHVNSMVNREKDLTDSRLGGGPGMVDHKLMVSESEARAPYGLVPDTGLTPHHKETDGHLPLSSRDVDMQRFEHRDSLSSDKMPVAESYKRVEKPILHATEVSHPTISPSYMKDYASTSQLRDHGSSSLGMPRSDMLCSHHDGNHLPDYYELSRGSGKLPEPVGYSGYGQRPLMDTARDAEPGQRNIGQQRSAFSPTRAEEEEYFNSNLQAGALAERGYRFDNLHRRVAPHGRLDYDQAQMEYNNRELPTPFIMNHVLDRNGKGEEHYGNHRRGSINDHPASQKPKYVDYPDIARTSISSKQHEDCLNSGYNHFESDERMPREYEASYLAVSDPERSSILRLEYESQRNRGPGLQQERFQNNPLTKHDSEAHGHAARVHDMEQGLGIHDHSNRQLKRKYNADDMYLSDSRTIKSYEWDAHEEYQDPYEDEDWIDDEEMNVMYSYDNVGLGHKFYRKDKRQYNELDMVEGFPSDDQISYQDPGGYVQRQTFRFHKYSYQNVKSHPRSNFSSWNKPHQFFKRNSFHKQPKVWKKYHGYDGNAHTNNDELSEDLTSATEPEPTEGSEEFNQKVQEAFLTYSKRLNVNSYVQRRYKEQGKAGSLFCIVCGRSSSKEFLDTQRLVTHAFMSHKPGLRTEHLGLHKAICVLLGWDTVVPQDTVTWVPQVLPKAEALAQKEDLIIWPPVVVIHNVSMSDDNPQKWKVVSMETVEAFIRGKGFLRGRIKVCLGKPADQSVILVKFLGTFVGLGDAERLNNYFSDYKRGRLEFERIKSKTSRCCVLDENEIQGDKMEGILYGYMGIAEDMDILDFHSKKRCIIKSRKEIEQLEKDPVKACER
ncbi:hypothetical protein QN277_011314 [Acacia crassicarpa]|uniref:XS domain-containing protein n=1 Tax=Acacia crassicarpa TaxID=499986 RepID=A0AAE1MYA8_9FABA|nr:hypothetical protein QN277_011314 [Acacia crassicarpa]